MDINIDDTNIKPKDINDLTKGSLTGGGVFDVLMASAELHIQDEYKKNRITGSNYATTYLGIIQTVLQLSTQFVLQQDNSWIELEKLKLEKEKLKIELELQQAELKIKETQLEIAKVQLEQEKQKIPLIKAQALTELAKTKDIIPNDEGIVSVEKFRNVKLLSEMTLEELWQLFPIILSPHNPEWKNFYKTEADLLQKHFGQNAARIRHIGSTAVAGLLAKPTVDILLETADDVDLATIRQLAVECGYTVMAETTVPEYQLDLCKGYTPLGFAEKVFHLHIRHLGDWDEPYFCKYLNQHPEKAQEYADLKMKLQTQFKHDRDAYTAAKGEFIRKCVKVARNIK